MNVVSSSVAAVHYRSDVGDSVRSCSVESETSLSSKQIFLENILVDMVFLVIFTLFFLKCCVNIYTNNCHLYSYLPTEKW